MSNPNEDMMRRILLSSIAALAIALPAAAQNANNGGGGGGNAGQQQMNNGGGARPPMPQANNPQGGQMERQKAPGQNADNNAGGRMDNARQQGAANPNNMDGAGAGQDRQQRQDAMGGQNDGNDGTRRQNADNRNAGDRKEVTKNISVTDRSRTVIRQNITRTNVVLPAGVSVGIGVTLPSTIAYVPVPAAIIAVQPELAGFNYIVVDGQIVFVDPATYQVVYVMAAV